MKLWQKIIGKSDSGDNTPPADLQTAVRQALNSVQDSKSGKGLVDSGLLDGMHINNDKVYFTLSAADAKDLEPLRQAAEEAVRRVAGVSQAVGVLTAERGASQPQSAPQNTPQDVAGIGQVKYLIAVASGKGGVGKSTVAANLAIALQAIGLKAGLLDADIYGPSQPLMMGAEGKPQSDGKVMQPHRAHGIALASIGFMVERDTPMIWRGPMVQSALMQLLEKVVWGALDVLIIDMPPGTGDAQLTLSQQVPLTGAVIVSTPQDIALIDAVKAVRMFEKVNVPILGLIENMSYFTCPHCGEKTEIFSHGGAAAEAASRSLPFLGSLPLAVDIRSHSDNGTPITATNDNPYKDMFITIAGALAEQLPSDNNPKTPEIIFS